MIAITINEDGSQTFIRGHSTEMFLSIGEITTKRGSHVVPDRFWLRLAFRTIRFCVPDTSRLAAWTRTWACLWRVDTSPVGGPILANRFTDRQVAITAEIQFLNKFFLGEK
jgi:hypothetical protein